MKRMMAALREGRRGRGTETHTHKQRERQRERGRCKGWWSEREREGGVRVSGQRERAV
jgi:hypothetical protein